VDAGAAHHYVTPTPQSPGIALRLFLLLSALLAGLTGLVAGGPAQARVSETAAVAAATGSVTEQVREAVEVRRFPEASAGRADDAHRATASDRPAPPQSHHANERRLE
jgi:hypothetical protein